MGTEVKGCKGCMYQSQATGWCNYMDITGQSRLKNGGSLFPGGGCALYKAGTTPHRHKPIAYGHKVDGTYEVFAELYSRGLNDKEIAAESNRDVNAVSRWRKKNGLESNFIIQQREKQHARTRNK